MLAKPIQGLFDSVCFDKVIPVFGSIEAALDSFRCADAYSTYGMAQSAITSPGPTLLINGRRTAGPFHVMAIGDPAVLRGALEPRVGSLIGCKRRA